jgi:hypothetical protein
VSGCLGFAHAELLEQPAHLGVILEIEPGERHLVLGQEVADAQGVPRKARADDAQAREGARLPQELTASDEGRPMDLGRERRPSNPPQADATRRSPTQHPRARPASRASTSAREREARARGVARGEPRRGRRGRSPEEDCGQKLVVRSPEAERSVGLSIDAIPLLVNRTVVATTEQCEIRQRRGAVVRPMPDVMPLTESHPAAREAAASVAVVERAP